MSEKDGGPAFPRLYPRSDEDGTNGMTLRDYFAAKALSGELSAQGPDFAWMDAKADALAARCYLIADAMLKAREQ
jgi:hypothetical protein